jgi:hypothetical protein
MTNCSLQTVLVTSPSRNVRFLLAYCLERQYSKKWEFLWDWDFDQQICKIYVDWKESQFGRNSQFSEYGVTSQNVGESMENLLPSSWNVSKDKSENSYDPSKPPNRSILLTPYEQAVWLRIGGGQTLPGAMVVVGAFQDMFPAQARPCTLMILYTVDNRWCHFSQYYSCVVYRSGFTW